MPFIGQEPLVGGYHVLDNITTSATNTYNLQLGGAAFNPESANHLLVSLNGVIQKPSSSFSVSGSQITFIPSSGTLSNSDSIDFILALGNVLDIGIPSDNAITGAKLADNIAINTTGAITTTDKVGIGTTTIRNNLDFGVTSNNDHVIALRDNNVSRTILGLTNGYGVRVGSPSDGTSTENMFEIGQINASDGTTYQNTKFAVTYSGNATIADGDLVIGTSGHGIDFSATSDATGKTSELLDDYEEGTFSIAEQNGSGIGVTLTEAQYTKIGRTVHVYFDLAFTGSNSNAVVFQSLPFAASNAKNQQLNTQTNMTSGGTPQFLVQGASIITTRDNATQNLLYSHLTGKWVRVSGTYQIA